MYMYLYGKCPTNVYNNCMYMHMFISLGSPCFSLHQPQHTFETTCLPRTLQLPWNVACMWWWEYHIPSSREDTLDLCWEEVEERIGSLFRGA